MGARGRAHPSFGMTPTLKRKNENFLFMYLFFFFFEKSVSYQKKGGPVLLLVWQRLRTLGTFSCNAAHFCNRSCSLSWSYNVRCDAQLLSQFGKAKIDLIAESLGAMGIQFWQGISNCLIRLIYQWDMKKCEETNFSMGWHFLPEVNNMAYFDT